MPSQQSRISYNVHAQGLKDTNGLITHLKRIRPVSVLVMDGLQLCRQIKQAVPNTIAIHRTWPDDDIHNRISPEEWLKRKRQEVGQDDIWCYTSNEPGFSPAVIAWHVALIKLNFASGHPLKLVILNLSVGTPAKAEEWAMAKELLQLCDKYRSHVILGLHEYWGGVVTSGFVGSTPDDTRHHPNFIPQASWPNKETAKNMTMWHCGRVKFLISYCLANGIKPPRVIMTEHGADALGDIDPWLKSQRLTPPHNSIRGYHSLRNLYKQWYPTQSLDEAFFNMLRYADQNIYAGTCVEAQLIFCYGSVTGGQWAQFDIESQVTLKDLIEIYANTPEEPTVPTNPVPPTDGGSQTLPAFPENFASRAVLAKLLPTSMRLNVRKSPATTADIVFVIESSGIDGGYIPLSKLTDAEKVTSIISEVSGIWIPVAADDKKGWVFGPYLKTIDQPVDPPPPPHTHDEILAILSESETLLDEISQQLTVTYNQISVISGKIGAIKQQIAQAKAKL